MHKRREKSRSLRAYELGRHIAECERLIEAQVQMIDELRLRRIDTTKYAERLSQFEADQQLRIQERDLLVDGSDEPGAPDPVGLMALKFAGLGSH
jgi:hypothetical protein